MSDDAKQRMDDLVADVVTWTRSAIAVLGDLPLGMEGEAFEVATAEREKLEAVLADHLQRAVAADLSGDADAREPDDARVRQIAKDCAEDYLRGADDALLTEPLTAAVNQAILHAFAEYHSALRTQRSDWYRKYSAEQTARINAQADTARLNHFIVNTCRFQIDMDTGETHRGGQIYATLRDAIDADMKRE